MTKRSMTRGLVVIGVVLGLALTGCTESRADTPTTAVADAAVLDRSLAELVAMPGGPPGVIAMVQVRDHVTVRAAGVAKVGNPPAANTDTATQTTSQSG